MNIEEYDSLDDQDDQDGRIRGQDGCAGCAEFPSYLYPISPITYLEWGQRHKNQRVDNTRMYQSNPSARNSGLVSRLVDAIISGLIS